MTHPIAGPATASLARIREWAQTRNAADVFIDEILPALWLEATRHGLDPVAMAAQSALETGYGRFGRAATVDHRNTAGIKIRRPGDYPDDAGAIHAQFGSWQEGARAHAQHLCAYTGLPIPDRLEHTARAVWVRANNERLGGPALYVEDLGGDLRWAPSPTYGDGIARLMDEITGIHPDAMAR